MPKKYFRKRKEVKALKRKQYSEDLEMLFTAMDNGRYKLAKILILGKLSVNCKNSDHATPITVLCKNYSSSNEEERLKFIKFLLKRRAKLNIKDIHGMDASDYIKQNSLQKVIQLVDENLEELISLVT
ncbi:Hypothetical predicted protein [Mytilus galloprovincialis]|uniref:Uncharacterized protein n=1 Tax=Mytilus galloprovincialis TaxID=29158 RepID=A0A8B6FH59_MYTGA|nr:Hypothetical predicted protein [Mytilus galloprovincialis]